MAIDRISPLSAPLTVPERIAREQPGQVQMIPRVGTVPGEEASFAMPPSLPGSIGAIIDAADGLPLPQSGLATLAGALNAQAANAGDPAAMRPDQLLMSRQLVWHPPDTATMAISWLVMVRTYAEQRAAQLAQQGGQHVPSSLFMADHTPNAMRDGRAAPALVSELESWRFAVYAWGSEKLLLRVVSRDPGQEGDPRRRRPRIALRLELHLPELGKVIIQMEPTGPDSVVLEIATQQNAAMQHMRELLPQLAATISRGGLSIVRCRLMRELPPVRPEGNHPTRVQTAMLTQAVFKAMAEVAVLLSHPPTPKDLFSESA